MLQLESPRVYLRIGVIYLALALPGLAALLAGRLFSSRNAELLFSLLGLPLGALFILFGTGRRPVNPRSWIGIRIAVLALGFAFVLLLSRALVAMGLDLFMTSVRFCLMAASYLSLLALVFLLAAATTRSAR